jgi:hypothetical protein
VAAVLAMPGSEWAGWQVYFSIYPFTFDREDWRHAELLTAILNDGMASRAQAAGKRSFTPIKVTEFMPDYLPDEITVKDPKQRAQYAAFKSQLADAKARAGVV